MSKTESTAAKDLTETMEETMQRLQGRFQTISNKLLSNNEMGTRIDDLERNVSDLMSQSGTDTQQQQQPISK